MFQIEDNCLFVRSEKKEILRGICMLYVYDLLVVYSGLQALPHLKIACQFFEQTFMRTNFFSTLFARGKNVLTDDQLFFFVENSQYEYSLFDELCM